MFRCVSCNHEQFEVFGSTFSADCPGCGRPALQTTRVGASPSSPALVAAVSSEELSPRKRGRFAARKVASGPAENVLASTRPSQPLRMRETIEVGRTADDTFSKRTVRRKVDVALLAALEKGSVAPPALAPSALAPAALAATSGTRKVPVNPQLERMLRDRKARAQARLQPKTTAHRILTAIGAAFLVTACAAEVHFARASKPPPATETSAIERELLPLESLARRALDVSSFERRAAAATTALRDATAQAAAFASADDLTTLCAEADRLAARGEFAAARSAYDRARRAHPQYLPAQLGFADATWNGGDRAAARAAYASIATSFPAHLVPERARTRGG